jgi:hypothetical protein
MENQKHYPNIFWINRTSNRKTGDIPTAFVGETRQESLESCEGCPLRDSSCYAQRGVVAVAQNSMVKRIGKVGHKPYALGQALRTRSVMARYARFTAIGDGARCNPEDVRQHHDEVRATGLGWLAYTHFREEVKAQGNQDLFCASTGSFEEADQALAMGFKRATVVGAWDIYDEDKLKWTTPGGATAIICPAMKAHSKDKRINCNQCGLCDPQHKGPQVVIFPDHSKSTRKLLSKAAQAGKQWAINLMKPL